MVSSKFARSKHAFRVPDVCKKKKEAEAADDIPYPPDPIYYHYNVDIVWWIYHYVFSGVLEMPIHIDSPPFTQWRSPLPTPTDGEWGYFEHNSNDGAANAYLQHSQGGVVVINVLNSFNIPGAPANFTTGPFEIDFPIYWIGTREGNVMSFP